MDEVEVGLRGLAWRDRWRNKSGDTGVIFGWWSMVVGEMDGWRDGWMDGWIALEVEPASYQLELRRPLACASRLD